MPEHVEEQIAQTEGKQEKPKMSVGERVKRITIAMFLFVILTQIIAHRFPDLFTAPTTGKTEEKPEIKVEEKVEQNPTKINAENERKEVVEAVSTAVAEVESQNNERIRILEEKLAQLEAANSAKVSELEEKISAQNLVAQSKTESIVFALITFSQLKEAVKNGEVYNEQLLKLKSIVTNNSSAEEIISSLSANSESGIKNISKLKEEFPSLIKKALADRSENTFMQTLHKFITVRKVGEQKGDSDEAVLARAELRLAKEELSEALQELKNLSQSAWDVFAGWIKEADTYLTTRKNIDKLELLLTQTEPAKNP